MSPPNRYIGKKVNWPGSQTPWSSDQYTPPMPGRPVSRNKDQLAEESATADPVKNIDQTAPIRDDFRFASINSISIFVPFIAPAPGQQGTILFLTKPHSKRNFLGLRNTMAAGNMYIDFGQPATQSSLLIVFPGQIIIFDSVVPQDDLYAGFDVIGGGFLTFGYSNYKPG